MLAGKLPKEDLHEVMGMLHESGNNPQVRTDGAERTNRARMVLIDALVNERAAFVPLHHKHAAHTGPVHATSDEGGSGRHVVADEGGRVLTAAAASGGHVSMYK